MRSIALLEHERLPIGTPDGITESEARRLRRFDEQHANRSGRTVLDWSRLGVVSARDHVGVIQVPGLAIEILPKTDEAGDPMGARRNLLYMLHVGGMIRARERSLATLGRQQFPLLDAFALVFAESLLSEMRQGVDRAYVTLEDNLSVVRGRLLIHEQVRRNAVSRNRLYVRYDEHSDDTPLNRILKCACRVLARSARHYSVVNVWHELLSRFDTVTDVVPSRADREVQLTRQNQRFESHLDFARMVLAGCSPSPSIGEEQSFSLLFPMHRVFEAFVARFIRRHARELGLGGHLIRAQARGKYLMRVPNGRRHLELLPDLFAVAPDGATAFVLDTKWKRLRPGELLRDLSVGDAYQLNAYAHRFESPLSLLLYPATVRTPSRDFVFEGTGRPFRIAFLSLGCDLRASSTGLVGQIQSILRCGLTA